MSNINCTGKIIAKKFELLNSNNDNSCISFLNSSNSLVASAEIMVKNNAINLLASNGATLNNNKIDSITEIGDGFVRYKSGLQICWGNEFKNIDSTDYQQGEIIFPRPFKDSTCYSLTATLRRSSAYNYRDTTLVTRNLASTTAGYMWYGQSYNTDRWQVQWIAIGKYEC